MKEVTEAGCGAAVEVIAAAAAAGDSESGSDSSGSGSGSDAMTGVPKSAELLSLPATYPSLPALPASHSYHGSAVHCLRSCISALGRCTALQYVGLPVIQHSAILIALSAVLSVLHCLYRGELVYTGCTERMYRHSQHTLTAQVGWCSSFSHCFLPLRSLVLS